jgi:hypothetical protein
MIIPGKNFAMVLYEESAGGWVAPSARPSRQRKKGNGTFPRVKKPAPAGFFYPALIFLHP